MFSRIKSHQEFAKYHASNIFHCFMLLFFLFFFLSHSPYEPLSPAIVLTFVCHILLQMSLASRTAHVKLQLHQSLMSVHRRAGLPCGLSPSVIPNNSVFTRWLSVILKMWPNNCSLRRLMTLTNVICRLSVFRMLSLLTLSFQHTLRSLLYDLISNANILLVFSAFRVHVSAAYYNKRQKTHETSRSAFIFN